MIFARDRRLRVKALLKKEFRQLMRDPKTKRFMFGAPIVQLLLFGYAVNTDVHDLATYVVAQRPSSLSSSLRAVRLCSSALRRAPISCFRS